MLRTQDYEQPEAVFIDYGVSREFSCSVGRVSGTPGYIPPETWQTGSWYPRGDCFSMGVTMLQMILGHVPANGRLPIFAEGGTTLEQFAHIAATRQPPMYKLQQRYAGAAPLISSLLQKNRPNRPVALQALRHNWLNPSWRSDSEGTQDGTSVAPFTVETTIYKPSTVTNNALTVTPPGVKATAGVTVRSSPAA